ncbi:MAG: hypothetical protein HY234_05905 [Acidobacteria bacterium]|nr:hypothetical protein [Acidobacteriota bacterium]MBI3662570.1 hypothetical protein [Acidobacteriota bacterium]
MTGSIEFFRMFAWTGTALPAAAGNPGVALAREAGAVTSGEVHSPKGISWARFGRGVRKVSDSS